VKKAEQWQWSSVWRREQGTAKQKTLVSSWPRQIPNDYLKLLNQPLTIAEQETLERSEEKNIPYGTDTWVDRTVRFLILQTARRRRGCSNCVWRLRAVTLHISSSSTQVLI
jgi:putative transposase